MSDLINKQGTMGTLPVFMTAISTILGAILFLRFGYAVAHVGLIGTLLIILLSHLVTIPTAMAVAEIATNQKVEGGGAYYMISRSFGLNIGAAIGIALFLSQAISVAFYVIALGESSDIIIEWVNNEYGYLITKQQIALVFMGLLTILMLTKGANVGVQALYVVVVVLFTSLVMFFAGDSEPVRSKGFFETIKNPDSFFYVFTIIFPAFTGIAAGLGLSGDLKDPRKSIPRGTFWATIIGMVVYVAVAFKLFYSATLKDMANDQLIMQDIAIWGPIIPIGLACAAVSSALGSVMIAPRTLQALGADKIFSFRMSNWFARGRAKDNEPFNASLITCVIAFFFIAIGDIDFVAQIISMFFMVTYGAICLISFLEHFAAHPSYRPTFKSKWYFSLFGALLCFFLMFKMNWSYALLSIAIMVGIYMWVGSISNDKKALAHLFKGVIFQANRKLQVYLQKRDVGEDTDSWRPFIICISADTFKRRAALDLVRWLSHRHGFGTYIHYIEGFLSKETYDESKKVRERLLHLTEDLHNRSYLDTIISPSFTSAIAQSIQLSGVSGKGNNMILLEYSKNNPTNLKTVMQNYGLLHATEFDVCLLRSSDNGYGYHKEIHIWITSTDYENANLMVLLGYILSGHPEWKKGVIKIFSIYEQSELAAKRERLHNLVTSGRLPISERNINLISAEEGSDYKQIINQRSVDADLTIVGYTNQEIVNENMTAFEGYDELGNILFVSAVAEKEIK